MKYENYSLGQWVGVQIRSKKINKLDLEKIQLLESLPQWFWNPREDLWNEGFEYLKKYTKEQGNSRVPARLKYENYSLGQWVMVQKRSEKNNKLDLEKIRLLESLPQWSWAVKKEI